MTLTSRLFWVVFSPLFLIAAIGCIGHHGGSALSSGGPIDGSYQVTQWTCGAKDMLAATSGTIKSLFYTFDGIGGSEVVTFSDGCGESVGVRYTYSAPNQFTEMSINRNCSSTCAASECKDGADAGAARTVQYSVSGKQLTASSIFAAADATTGGLYATAGCSAGDAIKIVMTKVPGSGG